MAHLLEGSVRHEGDTVRISAELINAIDGSTLWSQHYDQPYKDLFKLQDDITHAVASALQAPNYAFAHDQFALSLSFQGRYAESAQQSQLAATLDPLNPQVFIDAIFAPTWQNDYAAARKQVQRAAQLDPDFFFVPFSIGWIDIQAGKPGQAIPAFRKSVSLQAPPFLIAWLGYAYAASGDRVQALATSTSRCGGVAAQHGRVLRCIPTRRTGRDRRPCRCTRRSAQPDPAIAGDARRLIDEYHAAQA